MAHDLDQRNAASVEIDAAFRTRALEAVVQELPGILFHVDALDPDALLAIVEPDGHRAILCKRAVVLRNLISLGKVGVEIVLAREDRGLVDAAAYCERRSGCELDGVTIQDRQCSR